MLLITSFLFKHSIILLDFMIMFVQETDSSEAKKEERKKSQLAR